MLATKVRFPMGDGPNDAGLSRKHVTRGCEDSLRRLDTDYLDLYQVHCWDAAKSYAQIALNWLLRQPAVTAPITGARTLEQLKDNLGATGWELDGEQARRLSEAGALEDTYPYRFIRNAQRV